MKNIDSDKEINRNANFNGGGASGNVSGVHPMERTVSAVELGDVIDDIIHYDFRDKQCRDALTPVTQEIRFVHAHMVDALCGDIPTSASSASVEFTLQPNNTEHVTHQTPGLQSFVSSNLVGLRLFPNPNTPKFKSNVNGCASGADSTRTHYPLTHILSTDVSLDDRLATVYMALDIYRHILHELVNVETRDMLQDSAKPSFSQIEKQWRDMNNGSIGTARTESDHYQEDYIVSLYHRAWRRRTNVVWNAVTLQLDSAFTWLGMHIKFMKDSSRPLVRLNDALTIAVRLIQLNMHDVLREPKKALYHVSLVIVYLQQVRKQVDGFDSLALHNVQDVDEMVGTDIKHPLRKRWVSLEELRERFEIDFGDDEAVDSGLDEIISLFVIELFTGRDE